MTSTLYIDRARIEPKLSAACISKCQDPLALYGAFLQSNITITEPLGAVCSGEKNRLLLARAKLQDPPPPQMVQCDWLDVHTLNRTMVAGIYLEVLHISRMH